MRNLIGVAGGVKLSESATFGPALGQSDTFRRPFFRRASCSGPRPSPGGGRLDVDDYVGKFWKLNPQLQLSLAREGVGFAQAQVGPHLKMQVQLEASFSLH
jgi:hypothetical protein